LEWWTNCTNKKRNRKSH